MESQKIQADEIDRVTLPWRVEDIDFSQINYTAVRASEELMLMLCASSFIESGSDLYTKNLVDYFGEDAEVSEWLRRHWEHEELQHGRALKTYIHHVWPQFDWDRAFANFFAEYSKLCTVDEFEKTHALEMVARCVVETGTATLYRAINECSNEPVLKEITHNIRTDEVRHYKYFFKYFKKYNETERNSRWTVLRALVRRLLEIRNGDTEIALRHVLAIRYPQQAGDLAYARQMNARVNKLVRRHLSADMCLKMLLKPLDLPARILPSVHYPLTKLTQHLFFR